MQATTNRILQRKNLSLTEELVLTRELITNYMAAKPVIDACNARHDALEQKSNEPTEDFYMGDADDWE